MSHLSQNGTCRGWGRRLPAEVKAAAHWGARAIYTGRKVDLLPDRQSFTIEGKPQPHSRMTPDQRERKQAFLTWINKTALPWLRKEAKEKLSETSGDVIAMDENNYHIEASPQCSGGYLYIVAWENQVSSSL